MNLDKFLYQIRQLFSVKSAYHALKPPLENQRFWKLLWKWQGPQRISVFMWLASVNNLLAALWRSEWTGTSSDCFRCRGYPESVLHVLRDCPCVNALWVRLLDHRKVAFFFSLDHNDWFEARISQDMGASNGMKWEDVFRVSCWFLWK